MKLNLKLEKDKVIQTTFFCLFLTLYLGIYYILTIIPFYIVYSIEFEQKKLKKVDKFLGYHILSLILILFLLMTLQFLNPINAVKQSYRLTLGEEGVAELDTRGVQKLSEEIKERGITPYNIRIYLENRIEYKTDYENYGIVEYWATPYETIKREEADCDDYSILTKAITNYLDKDEEYKKQMGIREVRTKIIYEPRHSYTETNGKESGKLYTEKLGIFMFFLNQVWSLPLVRKVIFFIGIPLIIFRRKVLESSQRSQNEKNKL